MKIKDITDEQFDSKLHDLANDLGTDWILSVPGVYELVSEALNNDVLEALTDDTEDTD